MLVQLVATGQYMENYGAHSWDGQGSCPQYWKPKGSHEVILERDVPVEEIDARTIGLFSKLAEVSWDNEASSVIADNIGYYPNGMAPEDFSAFDNGFDEDVTSIPAEAVAEFRAMFPAGEW